MDNLAHSLVGLTAAKAGLEKLSPYATTVCLISANAADADFISLFFGDRWTLLQYHRGITHSIVGTIAIGLLIPISFFALERIVTSLRKRGSRIRLRGLLLASMLAAVTHPLMDWTNNYGVRPFLPWSGKWFYGDLVFIVDPFILLLLGGAAFLATSDRWPKMVLWALLGAAFLTLSFVVGGIRDPSLQGAAVARTVLLVGVDRKSTRLNSSH